jgi:two-component system, OmpR family, aerobic respiration control sensor histidine kinase ArcB
LDKSKILEILLQNIPGNIYLKDITGRYLFCNQSQLNLVGLTSLEEIINKTDFDLYEKQLAQQVKETDDRIMQNRTTVTFEEQGIDDKGNLAIYLTKKAPVFNAEEEVIGLIGSSIDITLQKQAERAKNDFISNMEHDLRTPFSGIGGIASLLYEEETDPSKKELLGLMITSCNQWESVHTRIFDSLVLRKTSSLKKTVVSISQELQDIRDMTASIVYLKKLTFTIEPIPSSIDKIKTDKMILSIILSNLISNAIKFTHAGSIKIIVSRDKKNCKIQIIDTGIGIPEDKFDYVFERFTKLSLSNKHKDFTGIGLGLYTAQQCAKELGATITLESNIDSGSNFTLILPLIS